MHMLICVTFSLPPCVGGWLRFLLVALPGLFYLLFFGSCTLAYVDSYFLRLCVFVYFHVESSIALLFVIVFSVPFSIVMILALIFVLFLFLLGSGVGCGLCLWHSLDFSINCYASTAQWINIRGMYRAQV